MKNTESDNLTVNELNWEEYCVEVFGASSTDVENALINDQVSQTEIDEFKMCTYYFI